MTMQRVLVTGGGGFLGGAIVRLLRERGMAVRNYSRGDYPALAALGVEQFRGELTDEPALRRAAEGCDTVFHVAAKAGVWGPYADYYSANVLGTRNVLSVCQAAGVSRLIHTSSPSVVHAGGNLAGANESLPYPKRFETHYPRTKAEAEQWVLSANGPLLSTAALRPHLIWGPGDNHLTPRIVARGKAGQLRRIGRVNPTIDATYIDNAAAAHLAAADRLAPNVPCAGRAYFIANDEPLGLWTLVDGILGAAGLPPTTKSVPFAVAYAAGAALEAAHALMNWREEPRMTRFVARQLATDHWFDLSAAKRDLGYHPTVSVAEGLERLAKSFGRAG